MSDLVALGDLLDGMVGDDPGFDEVQWAVREIKSLTLQIEQLCGRIDRLRGHNKTMRVRVREIEND